jgi:hypothetical protein
MAADMAVIGATVNQVGLVVVAESLVLLIVISKILLVETAYPGKAMQGVLLLEVVIHHLVPEVVVVLVERVAQVV